MINRIINKLQSLPKAARCGVQALAMLPVAVVYLLLFSPSTSPFFHFEGYDSAVFRTLGQAILMGKTPYLDIFDNKGPILYFINALGLWMLPGRWGLLVLQTVGMTVALTCMYRTARMLVGRWPSVAAVLLALVISIPMMQEGGQCEEWAMYGFAVAMYLSCRLIHNADNERIIGGGYGLAMGLLFAYAFYIRPNDAVAVGGGLALGVAAWLVWRRQWRSVLRLVWSWLLGFVVLTVPILVFFASRHALPDLWYGMFGINIGYTGGAGMLSGIFCHGKMGLMLLAVALWVMLWSYEPARQWLFLFVPVMGLVVLLMGNRLFQHYYLVLFPIWAVWFAVLMRQQWPMVVMVVAVLGLSMQTCAMIPLPRLVRKAFSTYSYTDRNQYIAELELIMGQSEALFANIPIEERDSVWNYNCGWGENYSHIAIFDHNGIVPCNRVLYNFMWNLGIPMRNYQVLMEEEALPKWVFVIHDDTDDITADSLFAATYSLVDTNAVGHRLYRRI